ncbi:MAG: CYTH domain-containing protein [Prevotella histicola]
MSGLEIERKFLVHKRMDWKRLASSCSHIQQGYFAAVNTVRVRIRDDKGYLTIKGPSHNGGLSRYEFEKEITLQEAQQLMLLCESGVIDKHRYLVPYAGHTFEVDEFHGDNDGLVMAEVELKNENEPFESPDFIGKEVTGDRRFYNSHMRKNPFKLWRDTLPEEYR